MCEKHITNVGDDDSRFGTATFPSIGFSIFVLIPPTPPLNLAYFAELIDSKLVNEKP